MSRVEISDLTGRLSLDIHLDHLQRLHALAARHRRNERGEAAELLEWAIDIKFAELQPSGEQVA